MKNNITMIKDRRDIFDETLHNEDVFKVGDFEGPLDLLLFLIKSKKKDILDINLIEIADQYINIVMHTIDLDQASEYFLIASKLISLKSRSILNKTLEEDEIIDSDEENLIETLIKYEKIKIASEEINKIFEEVAIIDKVDDDLDSFLKQNKNVEQIVFKNDQNELAGVMQSLINRVLNKTERTNIPTIKRREYSVEHEINVIVELIQETGKIKFSKLIENKPSIHIAIIFLSILELTSKKILYTTLIKDDILIQLKKEVNK